MNEKIMEILKETKPECDFEESTDYIEDGLLDSFDVISIISILEEKFGIVIDGLDVVPENFTSVDSIIALVKKSGAK